MEPDVLHNEILLNSPALHSLSRQQLQKLCKTHSIKATGKTAELIDKLKQRGEEEQRQLLNGDFADEGEGSRNTRPSQQWEIIPMDTIDEDEEGSQPGTLRSRTGQVAGEFGSSKSSLSSSLRALASSIGGLKRPGTDTVTTTATTSSFVQTLSDFPVPPNSSAAVLDGDGDTSMTAPLPGSDLLPGVPAPRPSMATVTTPVTIRLVSTSTFINNPETPRLAPFRPAFDILAATPRPANPDQYAWMATPAVPRTYKTQSPRQSNSSNTSSGYVFGTPTGPEHSNESFAGTAASVLAEMNARLEAAGVQTIAPDILQRSFTSATNDSNETATETQTKKRRFSKVHEKEFGKMEGIGETLARKKEKIGGGIGGNGVRKPSAPSGLAAKKRMSSDGRRQSSLVLKPKANAGRRISGAGVRAHAPPVKPKKIPGSFGDDEEDEDVPVDRALKRPRINLDDPAKTVAEAALQDVANLTMETKRLAKEREGIKKKLDDRKRRRSSLAPPPPPKSRFGFFASAKNLVQGVWRGAAAPAPAPHPVSRPVIAKPRQSLLERHAIAAAKANANIRPNARVISFGQTSNMASLLEAPKDQPRSRSPIPSFGSAISAGRIPSGASSIGMGRPSNLSVKTASRKVSANTAPATSMGTRVSNANVGTTRSRVSSMGIGAKNRVSSSGPISSTNSRLTAPTASSLAKQANRRPSSIMHSNSNINTASSSSLRTSRPPVQKIFSEPLVGLGSPSRALLPDENNFPSSLGMAASAIPIHTTRPLMPSTPPHGSTAAAAMTGKVLPGRRPRISRSKVIAKLASQRAGTMAGPSIVPGKTRSSVGGLRRPSAGGEGVALAAKKRARQSEYARRQSRSRDSGLTAIDV